MASYFHLFNPTDDSDMNKFRIGDYSKGIFDYISGVSMFSTGILLAVIRLYEPFFLFLVKRFWLNCFGILLDMDEEGM